MESADLAIRTVWQVKASTLCNLRCPYCYEWDRLSDRARIPVERWERIFQAMADYSRYRAEKNGISAATLVVWHGGEPILLPSGYVRDVLSLQREVMQREGNDNRVFNAVQTNLFRLNRTLNLMVTEGFFVSASYDGANNIRVDCAGRDTQHRVRANLAALVERGAVCGVALVLGRHNYRRLAEIHDALEESGVAWLRINPMYRPPRNAPGGELALSTDEVVEALAGLMAHRLRQGSRLPVAPIDRIPQTLARYRQGLSTRTRDRRRFGETRFVVQPDGTLTYETGMGPNVRRLGNLFEQTMAEILRSGSYQASLEDSDAKRARHCSHCRYQDACNGRPLLEFQDVAPPGPCPVEARLCELAETSFFREKRSDSGRSEQMVDLSCSC
jgi:uncharacterized protein